MKRLEIINRTIDYIEEHLTEKMELEDIAGAVHYSKFYLHRIFTNTVGISIHDYVQRRQLTEAAKLLVFSEISILEIAMLAGYESQQAFTAIFKAMYKTSPNHFRESEEYYPLQLKYQFDDFEKAENKKEILQRKITFASERDIPAWMELVRLIVDGFPHLEEREHEAALRKSIRQNCALIMKEGNRAIGLMIICYKTGSIDFLGVHPLYRKQGITRSFLDKALSELMKDKEISITTFREGDKADTGYRDMLKTLGFAEAELMVEYGYPTQKMIWKKP